MKPGASNTNNPASHPNFLLKTRPVWATPNNAINAKKYCIVFMKTKLQGICEKIAWVAYDSDMIGVPLHTFAKK